MLMPSIQFLIFSSGVFLMGLLLGWVLWKLKGAAAESSETSEVAFWQDRFTQVQNERNLAQTRLTELESELAGLKQNKKTASA